MDEKRKIHDKYREEIEIKFNKEEFDKMFKYYKENWKELTK